MNHLDNYSQLFFPFRVNPNLFGMIADRLSRSEWWEEDRIDLRYFFRFAANKVDGSDGQNRCRHYVLSPKKKEEAAIGKVCRRIVRRKCYQSDFCPGGSPIEPDSRDCPVAKCRLGSFSIRSVGMEMYLFSTGVCLLTMEVSVENADVDTLINARCVIKKVADTRYVCEGREASFTLLDLAGESISEISDEFDTEFFFFTNRKNVIAYMTTLYYHEQKLGDDLLMYLQENVSLNFNLSEKMIADCLNKVCISYPIVWGVSDQSTVCVCSDFEGDSFLNKTFYGNFRKNFCICSCSFFIRNTRCTLF